MAKQLGKKGDHPKQSFRTKLSGLGRSTARASHQAAESLTISAAFTGQEKVGGAQGSHFFGDGGRYELVQARAFLSRTSALMVAGNLRGQVDLLVFIGGL